MEYKYIGTEEQLFKSGFNIGFDSFERNRNGSLVRIDKHTNKIKTYILVKARKDGYCGYVLSLRFQKKYIKDLIEKGLVEVV